ncbi:MAG: CHC2 zinc finger domain-containing protein [Eubacteriales bacterium]|nr:CHC2 zinc finger domain-containing protein [Eubacteriales bacterium]
MRNIFEQVKEQVTARQVGEYLGIHIFHNGMCCCPFHSDKHPSMKIEKTYHCFGCGVGGDAIDLAARLQGISQYEAAKKIIADFHLPIELPHKKKQQRVQKKPKETEQQRVLKIRKKVDQWITHAIDVLIHYLKWIEFWKECYRPEPEDEDWHDLFVEALNNERKINDYLDILMFGTGEEMIEFFRERRDEVNRIEKRINEYERRVYEELRGISADGAADGGRYPGAAG